MIARRSHCPYVTTCNVLASKRNWSEVSGEKSPLRLILRSVRVKRWLSLALKFGLSALLIGFLLDKVNLGDALAQVANASLLLILLSALMMSFQLMLGAFRWQSVLLALDAPLGFVNTFKIV